MLLRAIGELLPAALGVALNPFPVIAAVLLDEKLSHLGDEVGLRGHLFHLAPTGSVWPGTHAIFASHVPAPSARSHLM